MQSNDMVEVELNGVTGNSKRLTNDSTIFYTRSWLSIKNDVLKQEEMVSCELRHVQGFYSAVQECRTSSCPYESGHFRSIQYVLLQIFLPVCVCVSFFSTCITACDLVHSGMLTFVHTKAGNEEGSASSACYATRSFEEL